MDIKDITVKVESRIIFQGVFEVGTGNQTSYDPIIVPYLVNEDTWKGMRRKEEKQNRV